MDFSLFSKLAGIASAPGREELLAKEVLAAVKPCCDEVYTDRLGNIIAVKKGKGGGSKVMVAAHMDEVSLKVRHIDDKGFLYFTLTGGIDPRTLLAQRVLVMTEEHGLIPGVIGAKAAHYLSAAEKAQGVDAASLCIDTGYGAEEAHKIVSVGDPVVLDRTPRELGGDLFTSKAIDDRVGVYVLLEVIKNMPKTHRNDIYFVFSVQEEYGLIGAEAATFNLNPEVALAIDATGALDTPGMRPQDYVVALGKGIGLTLSDSTTIADRLLSKHLIKICKEKNIPYQLRVAARGSNDAKVMQRAGGAARALALSVPVRYIHSNVETACKSDVDAAYNLVLNFVSGDFEG